MLLGWGWGRTVGKVPFLSHGKSTAPSWLATAGFVARSSAVKFFFSLSCSHHWKESRDSLNVFHLPGSRACPELFAVLLGRSVLFSHSLFCKLICYSRQCKVMRSCLYLGLTVLIYCSSLFSFALGLCIGPRVPWRQLSHCALLACWSSFFSCLALPDDSGSCLASHILIHEVPTCPTKPSPVTENGHRGHDLSMQQYTFLNATSP